MISCLWNLQEFHFEVPRCWSPGAIRHFIEARARYCAPSTLSHPDPAPRVVRFMTAVQMVGSLWPIPVGIASVYSILPREFLSRGDVPNIAQRHHLRCSTRGVDASTLRMLVRRDVVTFEKTSAAPSIPRRPQPSRPCWRPRTPPIAAAPPKPGRAGTERSRAEEAGCTKAKPRPKGCACRKQQARRKPSLSRNPPPRGRRVGHAMARRRARGIVTHAAGRAACETAKASPEPPPSQRPAQREAEPPAPRAAPGQRSATAPPGRTPCQPAAPPALPPPVAHRCPYPSRARCGAGARPAAITRFHRIDP